MARIQHIAIIVNDPAKTAEYYKTVFEMKLNRSDHGVWLTDGYFYFAVLPKDQAVTPLPGEGVGIEHFGFVVEDLEASCRAVEAEGCTPLPDATETNRKYTDPDGMFIDLRSAEDGFWDRRVGAVTQLLKLVPADN